MYLDLVKITHVGVPGIVLEQFLPISTISMKMNYKYLIMKFKYYINDFQILENEF